MVNKMEQVRVKQIKSTIKCHYRQKRTIIALGLGKINKYNDLTLTPAVMGMLNKVRHLVIVEKI